MATSNSLAGRQLRKSTLLSRSVESKSATALVPKEKTPRNERSRRSLYKKKPMRSPRGVATSRVTEAVTFKGQLFTIGDIVALDASEETYYGQVNNFFIFCPLDPFCSLLSCSLSDIDRGESLFSAGPS